MTHIEEINKYISDVLSGEIVACRWTKLACQRHLDDLAHGHERGLYFDEDDADFAIDCFRFMRHSKGAMAGKPFELLPYQKFIVGSLFGWKRTDGLRRFRKAYLSMARRNGKSTLASGIALLLFALTGEAGAEVYSAATMRDQAQIVWEETKRMVEKSPQLAKLCKTYKNVISVPSNYSKFEPVSSDEKGLEGKNVSGAIIDELHAHPTRAVWDAMNSGTASRTEPMVIAITTAGFNSDGICYEVQSYIQDILDPESEVEDDSFFGIVFTLDDDDLWSDESVWIKANPNIGVNLNIEEIRNNAKLAARSASALNNFLVKSTNQWVQQSERWIALDDWDTCKWQGDPTLFMDNLLGRKCYAALDLSSKNDLNSLCLAFPPDSGHKDFSLLFKYWLPEETIRRRKAEGDYRYEKWVRDGHISTMEGAISDYDVIIADLKELRKLYKIEECAVDPWNANGQIPNINKIGIKAFEHAQNYALMTTGSKEFEARVLEGDLTHAGDPVTRFCIDCAAVQSDPNGNIKPIKPDRGRSKNRIDGVVVACMAVGRARNHISAPKPGIRTF